MNAAVIGAVLAAALAAWAGPAQARVSPPPIAKVLAPSNFQVVQGGAVKVVVRPGPHVHSLRVTVAGQNVTRAFRRRGADRVATLHVRRGSLHFGNDEIVIRTTNRAGRVWFSDRHVIMLRTVLGLVHGPGGLPLGSSPAADTTVRVKVARRNLVVWAFVHGARRPVALPGPARVRSVRLSADDGLRPGVNHVRVEAFDPSTGTSSRRLVKLALNPKLPVAGAGRNERGQVGRMLVANGTGSSAPAGAKLRFHWKIVQRPRGSHARLRDATSARPHLRPDVRGSYVLRLTVGNGHRRAARDSGQTSDEVTLTAVPQASPIGVPIDTIATAGDKFGVSVGGQFYPADPSAPLQLVVLSRTSLQPLVNSGFADDAAGAKAMATAITTAGQDQSPAPLVIVTKPVAANTSSDAAAGVSALRGVLASLGASIPSPDVLAGKTPCGAATGGSCSQFSVIGVPGLGAGDASVNPGLGVEPGLPAGDLHGYLQQDMVENGGPPTASDPGSSAVRNPEDSADDTYSFVDRQRVTFDTGAATDDPAKVTVGAATYTSQQIPVSPGGFFVVVLDAGSLTTRLAPATFADNSGALSAMNSYLQPYVHDPTALVIVRSIGKVARIATGNWDAVGIDLGALGGSRYYFNYLNGSSSPSIAQVGLGGGPAGFPSSTTQLATQERTGSARLSGLLARTDSSAFYPAEATPPGAPLDYSLTGIIADGSLDRPWPNETTPPQQAVSRCIADNFFSAGKGLGTSLEDAYTDRSITWSSHLSALDADGTLGYDALVADGCTGFTEGVWEGVKRELTQIWPAVDAVQRDLIPLLQAPYLSEHVSPVYSAVHAVNDTAGVQSQQVGTDWLSIASDALWLAASIETPVAPFLNAASAAAALADGLILTPDGQPALTDVSIAGDQLADALALRYLNVADTLAREGDIITGDYGKLMAVYDATGPKGQFATTNDTPGDLLKALTRAESREAYRILFAARYALYRTQQGTADPITNVTQFSCSDFKPSEKGSATQSWRPFAGDPRFDGSSPQTTAGGPGEQWAYAGPGVKPASINSGTPAYPSDTLLTAMFTPQNNSAPLFNTQNFPLETYNAGANATTYTHESRQDGFTTIKDLCVPASSAVDH